MIVSEAKQSVCQSQAENVKKGGLTFTHLGEDGGAQVAPPVLPAAYPASSSTSAHNLSPSPPALTPVCTSIIRLSPTSQFSPRSSPIHQGEVMSLHQALGGSPDSEDDEPPPQPAVLRAGGTIGTYLLWWTNSLLLQEWIAWTSVQTVNVG